MASIPARTLSDTPTAWPITKHGRLGLSAIAGHPAVHLEVVQRTLRVYDPRVPVRVPEAAHIVQPAPAVQAPPSKPVVAPPVLRPHLGSIAASPYVQPFVALASAPPTPAPAGGGPKNQSPWWRQPRRKRSPSRCPNPAVNARFRRQHQPYPRPAPHSAVPGPTCPRRPYQGGSDGNRHQREGTGDRRRENRLPQGHVGPGPGLEADLGVDTVKQAEVFAAVRAAYGIPRDENVKLRDFPTLAHIIRFAQDRLSAWLPHRLLRPPRLKRPRPRRGWLRLQLRLPLRPRLNPSKRLSWRSSPRKQATPRTCWTWTWISKPTSALIPSSRRRCLPPCAPPTTFRAMRT